MNGSRALFDSNIIIYISKRNIPFSFIDQFDDLAVSVITFMEVLGYSFENFDEEIFVRELLSVFRIIYVDQLIADIVVQIRKKRRIKLPDAIIAATAISKNLQLVTRNVEDFENIDVKIANPFNFN
jgi:predicted nucleic acid-binding protein